MRKLYIYLAICCCSLSISYFFAPYFIKWALVKAFQKSFVGSAVNIGSCKLEGVHGLRVFDLSIAHGKEYDFKLGEISLYYSLSSLLRKSITGAQVRVDSVYLGELNVKNGLCKFAKGSTGALTIDEIKVNKITMSHVSAQTVFDGHRLSFVDFTSELLGGEVNGKGEVVFDSIPWYTFSCQAKRLSLAAVERNFELSERLQLSGFVSGEAMIMGSAQELEDLRGDFYADDPGGKLTITDESMLKDMAGGSGEQLQMVMENLKVYQYNTGELKARLEQKDVVVRIRLDGAQGERKFEVVLHP
jgi:hypothetical protein